MGQNIYEQIDVTAAAGKEAILPIFTSTTQVKRKLIRLTCNNVTATIDILVYDEREKIGDVPCDVQGVIEKWLDYDREIIVGHQLLVGLRNGTGASVTIAFCVESEIG